MVYEPRKFREAGKDVLSVRDWAVKLVVAAVGIGFIFAELQRILLSPTDYLKFAHLALLAVVVGLVFLWFWATEKELNLLLDWLDPVSYLIPVSVGEVFTIIGFGLLLVTLVFAARDPFWFAGAFTIYGIALVFACKYMNSQIETAIRRSRLRAEADLADPKLAQRANIFMSALDVLHSYFLGRPSIPRLLTILLFSFVGLAVGVWWLITQQQVLALVTYAIFIVIIVLSEFIIGRWRIERDRQIRTLSAELREIERVQNPTRGI